MPSVDMPISVEAQVASMKKYVVFSKRIRIRRFLEYTGYFRASMYGKYLLSHTEMLRSKPNQDLLFDMYKFDLDLRKLLFTYCKKAEIQFKSNLSNAVSLKVDNPVFYLNDSFYTPTKSERDRAKRESNRKFWGKFKRSIVDGEKKLRNSRNKYPEFSEYRGSGSRSRRKLPSWAAFSHFEFGMITNMYAYLRGDLRKVVLVYGYSKDRYGKETTKKVDTWLDAIRNLRNTCSHHNKLVGKTSSIVLIDNEDDSDLLLSDTDLFSRLYALKKLLNENDSEELKKDLLKLVNKAKIDVFAFGILPDDWEERYERIKLL